MELGESAYRTERKYRKQVPAEIEKSSTEVQPHSPNWAISLTPIISLQINSPGRTVLTCLPHLHHRLIHQLPHSYHILVRRLNLFSLEPVPRLPLPCRLLARYVAAYLSRALSSSSIILRSIAARIRRGIHGSSPRHVQRPSSDFLIPGFTREGTSQSHLRVPV